jgi:hypothetical protein
VLALLALSGIKFTPYGEQCVREWRGQRKGERKTDRLTHRHKKELSKEMFFKRNLAKSPFYI